MAMNQPSLGKGRISCDQIEAEKPSDTAAPAWYVEVLGKAGWQPLRGLVGRIAYYPSYEDAVAGAVREWERSDRPTRPAPVAESAS
jgi:hypothetical protein